VYGIAPGAASGEWAGDGSVRVIVAGELAALVRDLPPDHTPGRREDLEAHRRVLSDAIERTTVIPMRFGIVMDGDHVVRERLLEQHSDAIGDLLHRLDGHVQMTVKAFYAEDALLRDVLAEHPDLRRRSAELPALPDVQTRAARIQLGEAISAAVEARRAEIEYALAARLAPYATDIRVEPPGSERVALNAQLLVPRDRRPELDAVVRELSETLDGILAFRYVGPLPPYSFTDISLEEEEEDEQP
jgi:hypothetical protein